MSILVRKGTSELIYKLLNSPRTDMQSRVRELRLHVYDGPGVDLGARAIDAAWVLFMALDFDSEARAEFSFLVGEMFFDEWVSEIARQQDPVERLELAMGTLWAIGSQLDARKKAELERQVDKTKEEMTRHSPHPRLGPWSQIAHALEELLDAMDDLEITSRTPEVVAAYNAVCEAARTLIEREQRLEQWAR